jgi:hypothetical protein
MLKIDISGLDKLQSELGAAQRAFSALDGEIATVSFDPQNPQSVHAAIQAMEDAVDCKVAPYRGNALVEGIVPKLKEKYRAAFLERAKNANQN